MPSLSVLLVVRNGAPTIEHAVRSILWQSWADWDLLVLDDGSTDDTVAIVRRLGDARIRLTVDHQRRGLAARLNEGIALATGDFIARMDADDVALPHRLAEQIGFLESNPSVDVVGGNALIIGDDLALLGARRLPENHAAIVPGPLGPVYLMHPTVMARRSWYLRNQYDPALLGAEDHELFVRAAPASCYANLPSVVLAYRETALRWPKLWRNRRYTMRGIVSLAARRGTPLAAVAPVLTQLSKAAFEGIAIPLGLGDVLARRRRAPATALERATWRTLLKQLRAGDAPAPRVS